MTAGLFSPPFSLLDKESGSIAVLSGLLCFKGAWVQSPGGRPGRLMLLSDELSRSHKQAKTTVLGICEIWQIVSGETKKSRVKQVSYLSVLVEHTYDLVADIKNVSPVKVWHSRLPLFLRTIVQEVKNVFGGKVSVLKTFIHEVHHCWVSQCVLQLWRHKCIKL